jgi:hypothetical protein
MSDGSRGRQRGNAICLIFSISPVACWSAAFVRLRASAARLASTSGAVRERAASFAAEAGRDFIY